LLSTIPTRFEVHHEREIQGLNDQVVVRSLASALAKALQSRTFHGTLLTRDIDGWHVLHGRDAQDGVLSLVCGIFHSRGWQQLILQVGKSPSNPSPVLALRGRRTKRRESVEKMLKGLKWKKRKHSETWTAKELLLSERPSTPLFFDFSTS
jgi:hypothetical protein